MGQIKFPEISWGNPLHDFLPPTSETIWGVIKKLINSVPSVEFSL